jgi:adenylate cyclase class IV
MNNIEVELRYEVVDLASISTFIEKLNFLKKKQDIDIYFDTREADLLSKGIFIRARNARTIDVKFNRECINDPLLPMQPYCEEYSFSNPITEQEYKRFNEIVSSLKLKTVEFSNDFFERFKEANNFSEHYRIEKERAEYSTDIFTIAFDEVKDLGMFLEVECMANDKSEVEDIEKKMRDFVKPLALKPFNTGYGTLFLRKNNFAHYLKSRFILKEDLIYREQMTVLQRNVTTEQI